MTNMREASASEVLSAAELISQKIAELGDWRGETLDRMRKLIRSADPDVVEEWKCGAPGLVARRHHLHGRVLQEGRQAHVREGRVAEGSDRALQLEPRGNVRRAIDIHEGEVVDASAFKALIRGAVALNSSRTSKPSKKPTS